MTQSNDRLDRIETAIESLTRIQTVFHESLVEQRRQTEERLSQYDEQIARHEEEMRLLRENLTELRAGQERQERILDYLMRRDGGSNQ